jgi:Flp pilus assembly protein TadD
MISYFQTRKKVAGRLLWVVGGLAALFIAGCASSNRPLAPASSDATTPDAEFENGADRPPSARTLYSMAQILEIQGNDPAAEYILHKLVAQYPRFMPGYNDLAELQMRQRRLDEAVTTLTAALRVSPDQAVLVNNLGMCHLFQGEYEQSLRQFTRATALRPDDARYRGNLAMALGMLGRYDESLAVYQQIMPASDAHHNLGVLCQARQDHARADTEFAAAQASAKPVRAEVPRGKD